MSILKAKKVNNTRLKDLKKSINAGNTITLNVLINSELHKKFKVQATLNGETMTDVVLKAIEGYLK